VKNMQNLLQKTTYSALIAVVVAALVACGGGGGGDPAPAGNTSRTGTMVYTYISELLAVDMATNKTRLLAKLVNVSSNRDFAGASVGPAGEFAVSYNTDAALSNTGWIVILKPDGSEESTLRLKYMFEGPPVISPDGSKIAFNASFYNGNTSITSKFVQVVSRTTGENLFFYANYSSPQWTPDGQVLLSGTKGLYIAEAKIGGQAVLIPNSQNAGGHSLSPDGKKIAFVRSATTDAPRHIYMMNIDGTGTRQVTNSQNSEETRVRFSPDGNSLMVTTYGCISTFSSYPYAVGNVDDDLIHVIPASSSMLDILEIRNLSGTALQREDGLGRCTGGTLSWR
jgi:dipeptidyl aminopeptidase/acylaminoacyl peptidase